MIVTATVATVPLPPSARGRQCAAQHFGAWMIQPDFMRQFVSMIQAGIITPENARTFHLHRDGSIHRRPPTRLIDVDQPAQLEEPQEPKQALPGGPEGADDVEPGEYPDESPPGYTLRNGVAIVCIEGIMTRWGSSFGGCSTLDVRRALRAAVADDGVNAIMLLVDSPGGSCAGTVDLADDIAWAAGKKTMWAYVADVCASAGYFAASQAAQIWGNRTCQVGSIGTIAMLQDTTGLQDKIGIKIVTISTAPAKGAGADGNVNDLTKSEMQREVNQLNEPFVEGVAAGRGIDLEAAQALADGRVHIGKYAVEIGLIDQVGTFDQCLAALSDETDTLEIGSRRRSTVDRQLPTDTVDPGAEPMAKQTLSKILQSGKPADTVAGAAGDDTTKGGAAADTTAGGGAADTTAGGAGDDTAAGASGDDTTGGGAAGDTAGAGAGNDTLAGGNGGDKGQLNARQQFGQFVKRFGHAQAGKYFEAGHTYEQSLEKHVDFQQATIAARDKTITEQAAKIAQLATATGGDKGAPGKPGEGSGDGGVAKPKQTLSRVPNLGSGGNRQA